MGAFQGPRDWGRLLTAMVTPFNRDGSVNLDETAKIAAHLVDVQKNDGIVVSGTTGESPTLKDEEKLEILACVLDAVGDRAAIVFGAGTNDTTHSIHMTREAEKRGAHGIMLVNPQRHPHVKAEEGRALIAWLTSARGRKAIAQFKLAGRQLFHPYEP